MVLQLIYNVLTDQLDYVDITTVDLSGYLPYSGATGDVDLGNWDLIISGAGRIQNNSYYAADGIHWLFDFIDPNIYVMQNLVPDGAQTLGNGINPWVKSYITNINGTAVSSFLTSLSGALLATGATTGATSQAQVFTLGTTISTLTAGRITFAGTSGLLSDDGALLWNNTTKYLGLGVAPTSPLHLKASTTDAIMENLDGSTNVLASTGIGWTGQQITRSASGTGTASPTGAGVGQLFTLIDTYAFTGSGGYAAKSFYGANITLTGQYNHSSTPTKACLTTMYASNLTDQLNGNVTGTKAIFTNMGYNATVRTSPTLAGSGGVYLNNTTGMNLSASDYSIVNAGGVTPIVYGINLFALNAPIIQGAGSLTTANTYGLYVTTTGPTTAGLTYAIYLNTTIGYANNTWGFYNNTSYANNHLGNDNVFSTHGTGNDLKFYHDGTNSWIENLTGILKIKDTNATGIWLGTATTEKVGFYGTVAVVQASAYTQTYSTAVKTNPNVTTSAVDTTGSALVSYGYVTAAQADSIPVQINALEADLLECKKIINALIDDLQAVGLVA